MHLAVKGAIGETEGREETDEVVEVETDVGEGEETGEIVEEEEAVVEMTKIEENLNMLTNKQGRNQTTKRS